MQAPEHIYCSPVGEKVQAVELAHYLSKQLGDALRGFQVQGSSAAHLEVDVSVEPSPEGFSVRLSPKTSHGRSMLSSALFSLDRG